MFFARWLTCVDFICVVIRHSIPLHGTKLLDTNGEPVNDIDAVEEMVNGMFPDMGSMEIDDFVSFVKLQSTNPEGLPPVTHQLTEYSATAAMNMPGKAAITFANSR